MVQPAKKRRIAAARAAAAAENQVAQSGKDAKEAESSSANAAAVTATTEGDNNATNNSILTFKLLEQHRATLKTLQSNIAVLAGNDDGTPIDTELLLSSSLALSALKSLQRQISLQVESHSAASAARRENVEECSLVLENLNYERNYLRGEISSMRSWRAGELEKLALNELGIDSDKLKEGISEQEGEKKGDAGDVDMGDAQRARITSVEEAVNAYLLGDTNTSPLSYRDPSNHTAITQKLQSDLQTRSSLVEQLSKSKLHLKELQKKRNDLRGFLNQIPNKVKALEKAGEGLSDFFYGKGNGVWKDVLDDDDGDEENTAAGEKDAGKTTKMKVQAANLLVNRPSCERTRRFQLAQSNLPSPLYTLYVQLVGYLDAWASLEKLGDGANDTGRSGEKRKKSNDPVDGFVGASGMDVSVADGGSDNDSNNWSVVLTLSPMDILPSEATSILGSKAYSSRSTSSTSANIKIAFSFDDDLGVVLASVKDEQHGNSKGGFDCGLLDNLFPGDDGLANANVSLSLLKQDEDSDENTCEETTVDENNGKPYYWCQVLGGLDVPPPSSSTNIFHEMIESNNDGTAKEDAPFRIQTCTKAVFRQLLRRIRAQKTLAAILEFLGKQRSQLQPLPIHSAMKCDDNALNPPQVKAKLHSWVEDTPKEGINSLLSSVAGASTKRYIATIKRKSTTLKATAIVDTANYPAKPPVWTLQNEDGSSGSLSAWGEEHGSVSSLRQNSNANNNSNSSGNAPPLFDATLHRIECHANQDLDKFVCSDTETTYDWILIHQLADIVSCWDEAMGAGEGSRAKGGGDDAMGGGGHGGRLRKGKDRRLTGFGERSPFWWYRHGL